MATSKTSARIRPARANARGGTTAAAAVDPAALTVGQVARLLSAAGGVEIDEQAIARHVTAGAPAAADGRINLVRYAAWLIREIGRRRREI